MQIVTGYKGEAHITSNDDQGRNQGTFGTDNYVLSVGSMFAGTIATANEIQIADGEGVIQGVHFRQEPGTYASVTIENGTQGMQRRDLIVARYTKDASTGVEDITLLAIKGEPAESSPAVPSYISGDILGGDLEADYPLYTVALDGVNVTGITAMFSILKPMKELQDLTASLDRRVSNLVKTKRVTYTNRTFTINNNGYVLLDNESFLGLNVISVNIMSWLAATGAWGLAFGNANVLYIIGTPGVTVNQPVVDVAYIS